MNPLNEKPGAETTPDHNGGSVLLNGRYMPPAQDADGKLWVRASALVNSEPTALYQLWRDLESVPIWQEQIQQVTVTGPKTSHWVMASGDKTVEWDSEILNDEPDHRIAWRSIEGDLNHAGEVIFEPAVAGRGTTVTVLQEFKMSQLANAWETLTGRNPKQGVIENLRHFKALAEAGEIPRNQGQPHGPRGAIGSAKASAYGEKIPTPPNVTSAR